MLERKVRSDLEGQKCQKALYQINADMALTSECEVIACSSRCHRTIEVGVVDGPSDCHDACAESLLT
eukprot:5201709-Amphidinium_carterae.1